MAHLKEQPQLDTVPESDSEHEASSSTSSRVSKTARKRRSRTNTQNADGILSFDEHGHHKPTYKHVKPHQKVGPYPLHRGHSNRSASSLEDLGDEMSFPQANEQRLVRSEAASPLMTATSSIAQSTTSLPPLDTSAAQNWETSQYSTMFADDTTDPPMMSAGLSGPEVTWDNYGPVFDYQKTAENYAPSSFSQATSFFDHHSALPSGEVSEVEDLGLSTKEDFDLDFDPGTTFSRTNTGSTGISFHPSQENLTLDPVLDDATAAEFAKMVEKGLGAFQMDAVAVPFLATESEETSLSTFADMFWPPRPLHETEAELNDSGLWP
ncbi:hypothetical protein N0V93_002869 [Gnomoniopsis smithogilvyi]|uniref:Uncharacterized protein n=1 Tax=Gnomoniopsis smithogilvyi TaxID=1191159 RepID=A0A9W8YX98_9PEZI|nr:hypothetical protein N0V93_002869 [Gnomoniopsis smithogilvyi]